MHTLYICICYQQIIKNLTPFKAVQYNLYVYGFYCVSCNLTGSVHFGSSWRKCMYPGKRVLVVRLSFLSILAWFLLLSVWYLMMEALHSSCICRWCSCAVFRATYKQPDVFSSYKWYKPSSRWPQSLHSIILFCNYSVSVSTGINGYVCLSIALICVSRDSPYCFLRIMH